VRRRTVRGLSRPTLTHKVEVSNAVVHETAPKRDPVRFSSIAPLDQEVSTVVIPSDAVSIVGIGQVPVLREHELSLRQLGAAAPRHPDRRRGGTARHRGTPGACGDSDRSHVVSSLAKALDAELEVPTGATLLSQNAKLMALYLERYGLSIDDFDGFALNAHANANHNPNALFHDRTVTAEQVDASPRPPVRCGMHSGAPMCTVVTSASSRCTTPSRS